MFCESKSRPRRGLDLTCRVESVSHSNCVTIQKDHVLLYLGLCERDPARTRQKIHLSRMETGMKKTQMRDATKKK